MAKLETERKRLERVYNERPPNALIINIIVSALIGSFLTTIAIRAFSFPTVIYQQSHEARSR